LITVSIAKFLINEVNKIQLQLAQIIDIIHASRVTNVNRTKQRKIYSFLKQTKNDILVLGNKRNLSNTEILLKIKSFFDRCVLYTSPQQQ
jgi:hypothetical protein